MALVTITSWALCRKAILPPGTSRMKWRFSFRSAWVLFRARSTSAAAPIHTSTLSASGIVTAQRMDLHGTDEVEGELGLDGVVESRRDAELRSVAGAREWKYCEYHCVLFSRNVGLQYRCPCHGWRTGGGYRGIAAQKGLCCFLPSRRRNLRRNFQRLCRRLLLNSNREPPSWPTTTSNESPSRTSSPKTVLMNWRLHRI